jgi:hypothetical protein
VLNYNAANKENKMKNDTGGQAAELLAMAEASIRGCRVCIPFCGKTPYDFILDSGTKMYRIQVKEIYFGKTDNGQRWMVDFMKPRGGQRFLKYKKYSSSDCDFLVAVCVSHRKYYVFPVDIISTKRQASFYFDSSPSALARNHGWVDMYEDAWPYS